MTTYEHLMLAMVFGATMGWLIGGLGLTIASVVGAIRSKIKARREKKKTENE